MKRPAHFTDADWADYQQCEAEHDDLMEQVADREAQLENGLVATYNDYELDFKQVPKPEVGPGPRTALPLRSSAPRRRSRGR